MTLEERKARAREAFKAAKLTYLADQTDENWRAFCDAKALCRRLGVIA